MTPVGPLAPPRAPGTRDLIGLETLGELTPEQISGFVAKETDRWSPKVHASGAVIQ